MAKLASLIKKRHVEEVFIKEGKKVQFSGIDSEEERNRSKRGVEIRRERKDNKKIAVQNRNGRIRATLTIIRSGSRAAALIRLCRNAGENDVGTFLHAFLNGFVAGNPNVRARLAAFRQVPANRFENLTRRAQNQLIALNGEPSFERTFRAYLPAAVVTSGSDSDSPRNRRRSARRGRWRQVENNHQTNEANQGN